jgi:hypothetical protein
VSLIAGLLWQDLVLALGSLVGHVSKFDALVNEDTVWPLRDSLPNAVFYLPTIYAFWTLELYLVTASSSFSFVFWLMMAVYRRPSDDPVPERE